MRRNHMCGKASIIALVFKYLRAEVIHEIIWSQQPKPASDQQKTEHIK